MYRRFLTMHTFAGSVHSRRRGGLSALLAAPVCLPLCVAEGVGAAVNCAPTVDTFLKVSTMLLCSTTLLYHTVPPHLPHALSRYIYPQGGISWFAPSTTWGPPRGAAAVLLLPSCPRLTRLPPVSILYIYYRRGAGAGLLLRRIPWRVPRGRQFPIPLRLFNN